jgi:hypothetical protein
VFEAGSQGQTYTIEGNSEPTNVLIGSCPRWWCNLAVAEATACAPSTAL